LSNETSLQLSFQVPDDEEIDLNDLEVQDFYETPLERMQKLGDSKSELEDDKDYDRQISDEPDEGEFSSDEYITPLQRTRLTRSGSQEQLQLWDGNDDDENRSSSPVGLNDREEDYHLRHTDAPNTDEASSSSEYYPHGPIICDDDTDIGHEEIIQTYQQMLPQHQGNQEQLSACWEKVTGTFMLDPSRAGSRARSRLETVESGDELSGDELRALHDVESSSDESAISSDDELSENECTDHDEAHMEPVPQVPPSPWQKVSAMLMSPQAAVKKFVNIHRAPNLDLKEKEEPKVESDESESEDFQPFMLKIKYPRRNSETSELSQGTASLKLAYGIDSGNTRGGTDIGEQDRWDSGGSGLSLESEDDADDDRTAPHTTLEQAESARGTSPSSEPPPKLETPELNPNWSESTTSLGSNISELTMQTLHKMPVNTLNAVWSIPNHHSVPKIHRAILTRAKRARILTKSHGKSRRLADLLPK
jgi:hypothetical protein